MGYNIELNALCASLLRLCPLLIPVVSYSIHRFIACLLDSFSITDDTFAFWRGLKDAGLLDEVIQEFQQELEETMKGLQQRVQDPPLQLRGKRAQVTLLLAPGPAMCLR